MERAVLPVGRGVGDRPFPFALGAPAAGPPSLHRSRKPNGKRPTTTWREAVAIEAYTGAIKHVVRLVRPTVVHIEVTKSGEPKAAISRRGGADETGSGVILKLDGGFYIVTNRHLIRTPSPKISP